MSAARLAHLPEQFDDPAALRGPCRVDVQLLAHRAHDDRRFRKPRFTHHVFGMKVRRRHIQRGPTRTEPARDVREYRAIPRAKPAVDDQYAPAAHDNAHVGLRAGLPLEHHRHLIRQRQRLGRGGLLCERVGPQAAGQCQRSGGSRKGRSRVVHAVESTPGNHALYAGVPRPAGATFAGPGGSWPSAA